MGVYIKGIKRPSDCRYCVMYRDGYCGAKGGFCRSEKGIDADCPIVEVKTPHGRLIDADAEYKALSEMKVEGEVFVTAVEFAKIEMEQVPTVIEAEVE